MAFEIEVQPDAAEDIVLLQRSEQTGRLHPAWYVLHPVTEGQHTVLAYRSRRHHVAGFTDLDKAVEVAYQLAHSVGATVLNGRFEIVQVERAGVGHIYHRKD